MSKLLYLDTETTGLDAVRNDLIEVSFIVEIDGVVKAEEKIRSQPFDYDAIDPAALLTTGLKVQDIKAFPTPADAYDAIILLFEAFVDRFDKEDKFLPAGYNTVFDLNFLAGFFRKANPEDRFGIGSFIKWQPFDLLAHLRNKAFAKGTDFKNFKLETVAAAHGLEIKAHDSASDVKVCRDLVKIYLHEFF
jgi:DNA polymerase-3 subunit epsilon